MSDIAFVDAWRKNDAALAKDAIAMWRRARLMPPAVAAERVQQLVGLTYLDGAVAGVTTATLEFQAPLKARFAMLRGAVAPDCRRHRVCYQMAAHAVRVLERWSLNNPQEKIVGVAAFMQSKELAWRLQEPTWPEYDLNLNLVAYAPNGEQIRVAWFKHAEIEPSAA